MIRLCILIYLILTASDAAAQDIVVRSGEHGDFTRLALDVPDGTAWSVRQDGRAADLSLSGGGRTINIQSVYARIDRSRIGDVVPTESGLRIELACDCTTRAFQAGNRMIVLDVQDATGTTAVPPLSQGLSFGIALDRITTPSARPLGYPAASLQRAESVATMEPDNRRTADPTVPEEPSSLPIGTVPVLLTDTFPEDDDVASTVALQKRLVEQIGRAASQGLLTPRLPDVANAVSATAISTEPARRPRKIDLGLEETHVRAETSVDTARGGNMDVAMRLNSGACLPDAALNIRDWADDALGVTVETAAIRARLFGEFDRIDRKAARDLARVYLHYGMGAEARQIISLIEAEDPDDALLRAMSHIVDDGYFTGPNPFAGQQDCVGRAALWTMLAYQEIAPSLVFDTTVIERTFNELPAGLRLHLGPDFAARLMAAGHLDLAGAVLRQAERATQSPDDTVSYVDATMMLAGGNVDGATAALNDVAKNDGPLTPHALIAMVETALSQDTAVSADIADRIIALQQEHRGTELAPALRRARILAHALASDFAGASDALKEAYADVEGADRAKLERDYYGLLADRSGADMFLLDIFSANRSVPAHLSIDTGNRIAERLMDAGFPEKAETFLERGAEGPSGRARRMLRSEIALSTNRPRRAEADLIGLAGPDVDQLRGRARQMAGDHAAAVRFYLSAGDTDAAIAAAWEGGLWQTAADLTDGALTEIAAMDAVTDLAVEGPPLPTIVAGLGENRTLLDESSRAREVLDDLLRQAQLTEPSQ